MIQIGCLTSLNAANVAKEFFNVDDLANNVISILEAVLDGKNDQVYHSSWRAYETDLSI